MANQTITSSIISTAALKLLKNSLQFTKLAKRDYDQEWNKPQKIGSTFNIRKPWRSKTRRGSVAIPNDFVESFVPLTIQQAIGIDVTFSARELQLEVNKFVPNVLAPMITTLGNQIDYEFASYATRAGYNVVGTPGQLSGGTMTQDQVNGLLLNAGVKLKNAGCDTSQLKFLMSPAFEAAALQKIILGFNQQQTVGDYMVKGMMGKSHGFEFYMSQNADRWTPGGQGNMTTSVAITPTLWSDANYVAANPTNNANTGYSLPVAALTGTLKAGSKVNIATVQSVNSLNTDPLTGNRVPTGQLQDFTVTADALAGATTINVLPYPVLDNSRARQNVFISGASVASGAAVTVTNGTSSTTTYDSALAFDPDAFRWVCFPLDVVAAGVNVSTKTDPDSGLSLTFTENTAYNNLQYSARFDVLLGWTAVYPELACQVMG